LDFDTQSRRLYCPCCGERIEIVVDLSVEDQEYIEDCSVCCRPITLVISVVDGEATLSARGENE